MAASKLQVLSSFIIIIKFRFSHFFIYFTMDSLQNNVASKEIINDLLKTSLFCIKVIKDNEEIKKIEDNLKITLVENDNHVSKRLRMTSNDDIDILKEEMDRNEEEMRRMNVDRVVQGLEIAYEKIKMSDSKYMCFQMVKRRLYRMSW